MSAKEKTANIWKTILFHKSNPDRVHVLGRITAHAINQLHCSLQLADTLVENVLGPIVHAAGGCGVLNTADTKRLIEQHVEDILARADLDTHFGQMRDHLRTWTRTALTEQLAGDVLGPDLSQLPRPITLLQDILEWCEDGRLHHAVEIACAWWEPADVQKIIESGLILYRRHLMDAVEVRSSLCNEMAFLMSIGMHKRYKNQWTRTLAGLCHKEHTMKVN